MIAAARDAATSQAAAPVVLLSPACASFDMFDNYEHRAKMFVQALQELALEAGAMLEGDA